MNKSITGTLLFLFCISLIACTSGKKHDYFRRGLKTQMRVDTLSQPVRIAPTHHIDVGDALEINFYTPSDVNTSIMSTSEEGDKKNKLNLFVVNSDGNIELPVAGPCHVKDLTIDEVRDSVRARLGAFFNVTYMYARINSFTINVLGEVVKPGAVRVEGDQINILQALSLAGDVGIYGNKRQVILLRKQNAVNKIYELDLTDLNILNSEAFFLQSNDVLYVKPVRSKSATNILPFATIGVTLVNVVVTVLIYLKK